MLNRGGRSFSGNERHCAFLNTGGDPRARGRFANVSAITGLDLPDDGRAVSVVDWDQDGDQDLWISNRNAPRLRFMRNDSAAGRNYLAVRLAGNGTTTNRDAIGARVEVVMENPKSEIRNPKSIKTLRAGEGFLAQSSKWIHFGLGESEKIENVIVRWPGGEVERFGGLEANRRYQLVQGSARASDATTPDRRVQLSVSVPKDQPASPSMRVPLVALLRVPDLTYLDFGDLPQRLTMESSGPLLINLWSTTCQPCLKELNDFTVRAKELRAAGIRIVALSVDKLEEKHATSNAAQATLAKMDFPFDAGHATKEFLQILYLMKKSLLFSAEELPLPASFLVDASGRLAVIYLGPVPVDTLLKDIRHSSLTTKERYIRSAALQGRMIEGDVAFKIAEKSEALAFLNFAESLRDHGFQGGVDLQFEELVKLQHTSPNAKNLVAEMLFKWSNLLAERGNWRAAADAAQKAIDRRPDSAKYHYNLGVISVRIGDRLSAQRHYKNALGIQPDMVSAHANLARLLAKEKNWVEAATHFREVIRARPDDAEAFYNLGVALAKQHKWKEASNQFRSALRIRPHFPQARQYLNSAQQNLEQDE